MPRLHRLSALAAIAAVLLATLLMLRQARNYNQVTDESSHIACGMEWLSRGTYTYEALHPPLARAAGALPLFLAGERSQGRAQMADEGNALLNSGNRYTRNLLLARLGILPFFLATCALIFLWVDRQYGRIPAALAVVFFCFTPPVLAHSALATTDAPFMAMFLLAVLGFVHLLRMPSMQRGAIAGLCLALAILCKYTAIPFFLLAAAILLLWHWRTGGKLRPLMKPILLGTAVVALIIWATFRFSVAPMFNAATMPPESAIKMAQHAAWQQKILLHTPVPAPEFFHGIGMVVAAGMHEKRPGFLLGHTYNGGKLLFFPVALVTKTPIAELLFAALGLVAVFQREERTRMEAVVMASGIAAPLLIGMAGSLNLGIRHILPVFPFLAMLAAIGASSLIERATKPRTAIAGLLIAWQAIACIAAAPQLLPYFNEAAMPFFGSVLIDSDLDWGQDFYHLEDRLRNVPPSTVYLAYWGDGTIRRHNSAGWQPLKANQPVTGWAAISESEFQMHHSSYAWLDGRTFERVGRSIRLYNIPN